MVKILSIFITTLATLSQVAQAGACKEGILNCGSTLQKFRIPGAEKLYSKGLYFCNPDGSVTELGSCRYKCIDGGDGKRDFCLLVKIGSHIETMWWTTSWQDLKEYFEQRMSHSATTVSKYILLCADIHAN
ncbi:hypothetical protein E4U32_006745 [Claviceps aff. humidiphila group G2b]|nr:hypothetical protein E4U32_006745 [Claviceps aff. humidiphila group G2b]